jgi:Carbohydrate-selective porin, OprB family
MPKARAMTCAAIVEDDPLWLLVERINPTTDFATSDISCDFASNITCAPPFAWYLNNSGAAYPVSTWGARAAIKPTLASYFRIGVYQHEPFQNAALSSPRRLCDAGPRVSLPSSPTACAATGHSQRKWQMHETFILVQGLQHNLWRAANQNGVVLHILAGQGNLNSILSKGEADLRRPHLLSGFDGSPETDPRNVRTDRKRCYDRKNLRSGSRDGFGFWCRDGTGPARGEPIRTTRSAKPDRPQRSAPAPRSTQRGGRERRLHQ